ncbi:MAG: methylmalonyl Co-A mutase-associated GTPase MeaB [Anaerolineales bacterium]|nr:methylmalonyl Co-A mutase-associated GTPase MeaB [Anaerolineales bacterium]
MSATDAVLQGERLAISRLLTEVENDTLAGQTALNQLFMHTGRAHLIGITGAPGTGKSSLVNQIALQYRQAPQPLKVAIVAVDPSSPFTGGAVLGDRVRMRELSGDRGVFIRSMATRGSLGGLAAATAGMAQVLDAAGFDVILIETVGAGQSEVEVAKLAHTVLVVDVPGLGDDVQAIKAGILEIADILVLNKADRPGVEAAERALLGMLKLGHPTKHLVQHHGHVEEVLAPADAAVDDWLIPIRRTVATDGSGLPELLAALAQHKAHLQASGDWQRRERARLHTQLEDLVGRTLMSRWRSQLAPGAYAAVLEQLVARQLSPRQALQALLAE